MNNYITLDTKMYRTLARDWAPVWNKPSTDRVTLSGSVDVTYGPAMILGYTGSIIAPVSAPSGWGTFADLKATLEKREAVPFIPHEGGSAVTVHVLGPFNPVSLLGVWDAASNEWHIPVRIVSA